ncbi:MAG TPA: hypothetical protein VI790_05185 [Candidatus Nanoarchaeia archaeon]|nr:hypothetical protein [Candidatus Nanoarchaeia archaeon]
MSVNTVNMLRFLLNTESLNELMIILESVCDGLKPAHRELRISLKSLRFTLLVLTIRIKSLIELINFRIDSVSNSVKGLDDFKFKINLFLRDIDIIHKLLKQEKFTEAVSRFNSLSRDYLLIYGRVSELLKNEIIN